MLITASKYKTLSNLENVNGYRPVVSMYYEGPEWVWALYTTNRLVGYAVPPQELYSNERFYPAKTARTR